MNKKAQEIIKELQKEIQAYKVAGESSKKAYLNELLKEIDYNQSRVASLGRKIAYLKVGSSK